MIPGCAYNNVSQISVQKIQSTRVRAMYSSDDNIIVVIRSNLRVLDVYLDLRIRELNCLLLLLRQKLKLINLEDVRVTPSNGV